MARSGIRLSAIQEFNPDAVLKEFTQAYGQGQLEVALRRHWAQHVPHVFTGRMDADLPREDRKAKRVLFRPMECFMTKTSEDPESVFRELKQRDNPPQLCGKVFKMGEPTYSCRDCGMDPTCVLCIDCFQHSSHKKHKYRMSTSGGGGYCDCGDQEAWKAEAFCDVHKRGLNRKEEQSPMDNLPSDIRERASRVFYITVKYAVEMLTWDCVDSLPKDLSFALNDDTYITMLFNDEVHTYEQVINTLQKAVECTQKEAIDFATTVDREGRSSVKDGTFVECEKARTIIEKHTSRLGSKPLKVSVMRTSVIAHQMFASKILTWLQSIIGFSDGLRQLFCLGTMRPYPTDSVSLVEMMMLADTKLWKAARVQSHQLYMAGVLMDPECKKEFSVIFTKMYPSLMSSFIMDDHDHLVCAVSDSVQIFTVPTLQYPNIMRDFIQDDHTRSVSSTACSVQIFTVPTLARMLITHYDLLHVILCTFLTECDGIKKNKDGKFTFERSERNQGFRRAQYMLYDLKYALTCKLSPGEWTDSLRANFLHGLQSLLTLLNCMQGMDAVTRQTGQHIEFEPEWEGAFNLQLKLEDNIAMMLDWCAADEKVILDAFNMTISVIDGSKDESLKHREVASIAGHSASCIKYDVSCKPVSIHQPVTRFLAGLYPRLNQFGVNLIELHKSKLSPRELMEPSLKCLVMIAQTQAGMWRRNGYSLLNQIYFYHNVKCRSEMYDKDIVMIQAAAALIDSNEFVVHILNKFGLLNWAKEEHDKPKEGSQEELVRQTVTLAGEFLNLLILIIGERYVPGIGEVSSDHVLRREIIHQLCVQPMAHSELAKALPVDPYHDTGIEDVVTEVAVFKKPISASGKGMYELKEECYKEYNPFFYHYTRPEQSKSEEAQRKRKKAANEDQALPPPVPPPFVGGFAPIRNLLQSDVILRIMRLTLSRSAAKWSKYWSDTQLEKILHLIGIALHEERRAHVKGDNSFHFIQRAMNDGESMYGLLEALVGHANVSHAAQKDLLSWVIKEFTEVRQIRDSSLLIDTTPTPMTEADEKMLREKKRKADLAAKRRQKIMNQMSKMQKDFIKDNADLFENTSTELLLPDSEMEVGPWGETQGGLTVAIGPKQGHSSQAGVIRQTCILCQEEQDITHNDRAMVLAACVQKSTVLSKHRGYIMENAEEYDPLFMPADLVVGAHTSTCGHVMHSDCWQRFFDAILAKERRRTLRFRHPHVSYDIEKSEFLCPLCETLSNTVIPIIPHLNTLTQNSEKKEVKLVLNDWLDGIQKTVKNSIQEARDKESEEESYLFVPCPMSSITKMMAESVAKNFQLLFEYVYDDASAHFSDTITTMLRKFSTDVYATGLGVHPDEDNIRVPVMGWSTCAFTIMTTECFLRDENKPLFGSLPSRQGDCLSALVRYAGVCSQVIQQDVVKKHCVTLLSALVCDSADIRLQETPCILDMDMFHYMVELCLSLPTLYAEDDPTATKLTRIPTGGLNDLHALQLTFTTHLVQIMLSADFSLQVAMDTGSDMESDALLQVYNKLRQLSGMGSSQSPSPWHLVTHIKKACLPFLRCSALFFHYLTGVQPPEKLFERCDEEFELICLYLALPTDLSTLFSEGEILDHLITSWCQDEMVRNKVSTASSGKLLEYPLTVNQLITLPEDYSELINKVSTFTCPKSEGDDSRAPTMCLVCGTMLCSQGYCCQTDLDSVTVGAATAHAHSCGAGTGIFLRVRECQVLLLSGRSRGCFFAPPYLDNYGETDQGLRRGNPLHLCPDRYKKLQKLWLSHGIPEEIAHLLESNSNLMSIEWQHL